MNFRTFVRVGSSSCIAVINLTTVHLNCTDIVRFFLFTVNNTKQEDKNHCTTKKQIKQFQSSVEAKVLSPRKQLGGVFSVWLDDGEGYDWVWVL